jgi:hypothetical protein
MCRRHRPLEVSAFVAMTVLLIGGLGSASAKAPGGFCGRQRTIQDFGGHLRPGFAARLVVAPGAVVPGHFAPMRIVNSGADEISIGAGSRPEHWEGGSWVTMPWPPGLLESAVLYFVLPESVSTCLGPSTFKDWPGGKYRWRLAVRRESRGAPPTQRTLRATFRLGTSVEQVSNSDHAPLTLATRPWFATAPDARSRVAASPHIALCAGVPLAAGSRPAQVPRRVGTGDELGKLRLETRRDVYAPGQLVVFGLINGSRVTVFFGEKPISVQRWSGSEWVTEESWGWSTYPLDQFVRPGRPGVCSSFVVPQAQAPGEYRVVLPVAIGSRAGTPDSRSRSALFRIDPS